MALIAHWPLNGNTNDVSGNGYDGTPTNITYVAGKIGQAASFNGSSSVVNTNTKMKFLASSSFSASLWVKFADHSARPTAAAGILGLGHFYNNTWDLFLYNTHQVYFECSGNPTRLGYVSTNSGVLPINTWHHITIVYNGGFIQMFLNGQLVGTTQYNPINGDFTRDVNLLIGQRSGDASRTLNGQINDVRIYNHALTNIEIQELARAKILHYTFDDFQEPTTNLVSSPFNFTSGYATSLSASNGTILNFNNQANAGTLTSTTSGYYARLETLTLNKKYTTTWILKQGTLTSVNLDWGGSHGGTRVNFTFNLITGEISSLSLPAGENYGVVKEVNGFWRIWYSSTLTSSTNYFPQLTLSGAGNIILGAIQIEEKPHGTEFVAGTRTGRVNDYSGFFNHSVSLTETNTPRWIPNAKIGTGAYEFYGNGTPLKIIDVSGAFSSAHDSYTISFWAKRDVENKMPIASRLSTAFYWYGDNSWRYTHGGAGGEFYYPKSISIPIGTWGHYSVVYNGTHVRIYRNGVYEGQQATTGAANFSNGFIIGNWSSSATYQFDGNIDDIRIYATALSDKDILDLYNTKAEIEQSGVLYARDFLSNAEATVNIATNSFLESGWTGSSELIDSATKTFRLSQPFPSNSSAWRTYYYNVSNYIGQTITISAFFRVLSETNGNFLDVTVGQGNTGSFPLHIKGSNEIDKFTSTNRNYHFISWTGVINSTGIVGFTVWIHNLVTGALIISELSKVQVEAKPYATPFVSTFRPAIELPTGVQFGADEIHETGIANFEDFSTVGITDGLIGYWPFKGSTLDYSGNNYHGSIIGSIPINADHIFFNGAITNYVQIPNNLINNMTDFSFIFKIRFTNITKSLNTVFHAANGGGNTLSLEFRSTYFRTIINDSASPNITHNPLNNIDYHYVVTRSGSTISLYNNGTLIGSQTTVSTPVTISGAIVLGQEQDSVLGNFDVTQSFEGRFYDLKVFNRALTDEEIKIEYNTMFNNEVQIHKNGTLYAKNIIQY
jgi:hypothetical protein